jgi:hypothetical protein
MWQAKSSSDLLIRQPIPFRHEHEARESEGDSEANEDRGPNVSTFFHEMFQNSGKAHSD